MSSPTKPVEQKARELLADRFWSNVEVRGSEECWPWLRGLNAGYPALRVDGKTRRASQVAWSLTNGEPFPKGMMACHRCDNPLCCNPGHIFVGTSADNVRDMIAKGRNQTIARRRAMTHCSNGHEYTPKNTRRFVRDGIWRRACRACQVAYVQKSFAKKSRSGVPHYRKESAR